MAIKNLPANQNKDAVDPFRIDRFIVDLGAKLGLSGIIIGCIAWTFMVKGTDKQKSDFIDRYILFSTADANNFYIYLCVILALVLFFQNYFFRQKMKIKDERIEHLTEFNRKLEVHLFSIKHTKK